MKIVHVTLGKANPERMNGVNKVVHSLATEMMAQGKDIEVWGITPSIDEKTSARTYPLHLFEGNGRSFALSPVLREAIEALPAGTMIHFHGVFIPVFYTIARLLKKRGLSWVVTPHGAYMPVSLRRNYMIKTVFYTFFDSYLLGNARAIHVITPSEKAALKKQSKKVPMVVVPNAYGPTTAEAPPFHSIYKKNRPVFGYLGRLEQVQKGLDILLAGFFLYVKQGGAGDLWLVGNGPHRQTLEKFVSRQGLEDRVRFWDSRFGAEKTNLLMNMDVFVHTSRWDVAPTAVLEAAALGLPLVISHETGLGDAVKNWQAGFVLDENTPEAVAEILAKCETFQRSNQLESMAERAKQMIRNDFTWKNVVDTLNQNIYRVHAEKAV